MLKVKTELMAVIRKMGRIRSVVRNEVRGKESQIGSFFNRSCRYMKVQVINNKNQGQPSSFFFLKYTTKYLRCGKVFRIYHTTSKSHNSTTLPGSTHPLQFNHTYMLIVNSVEAVGFLRFHHSHYLNYSVHSFTLLWGIKKLQENYLKDKSYFDENKQSI